MARRVLGSGRVLGNSSPAPVLAPVAAAKRAIAQESPAQSDASLVSWVSTPPIQAENGYAGAPEPPGEKLVCPICEEEMMTLLQLNRHLDDIHKDIEPVEQEDIKSWFRKSMIKAKQFQPVAVLNQKLKGLDVFESNDAPTPPPASNAPVEVRIPDPDEIVTRSHWQRLRGNESCSEIDCGKALGLANGSINCRHCGKLFCEEHTMYQMKLSRSAKHDPARGVWCRVCETCYKSREGYNDHSALVRSHTSEFTNLRRSTVEKTQLEVSRLEKRLTKLTQILTNPPPEQNAGATSYLWPLTGAKQQQKALEQSVVAWQDDASVNKCPFCTQEFTSYLLRRHHCRTCGRVVCADLNTGCSTVVSLDVHSSDGISEKQNGVVGVDLRLCKDCRATVFGKRDFESQQLEKPQDIKSYETLVQFEASIRLMLPKFQRLLSALQDPDKPPTQQQLTEATRVRKRLLDSFQQYNVAAKRILSLPTQSETQKALQKAIYMQAISFLQIHMLPLKSLPKVLKHATPANSSLQPGQGRALSSIKFRDGDIRSQVSSSSAVSALESEEKTLKERLIVLEEQKYLVSEMIADASRRRKFDEVSALAQNVEDLSKEIDQVNGQLGQLDFASAYKGLT